jgi:anti-sigma B factor antagonist
VGPEKNGLQVLFDLIVSSDADGVVVVSVLGELDVATAPRLRQELLRIVAESAVEPYVVLDLAGTDFLDATGLGAIFDGVKRTRQRGGDLALARAEPQVLRDLEITRVFEILPVHGSVDVAIASFGSR